MHLAGDDGIVVGVEEGNGMDARGLPEALSNRLGLEATLELVDLFERAERDVTETVLMRSVERFDRRLVEEVSKLRLEMLQGDAALRNEIHAVGSDLREQIANQKFELLKWSFLFWIGQVIAMAALLRLTVR